MLVEGQISAYDTLFSPLPIQEFINLYEREISIFLSGKRDKFDDIFSEAAFWDCLDGVENVRAVFAELRQATINPSDARDMFHAGATICATGVEAACPSVRRIAERLGVELGLPEVLSVKAYLSPAVAGFAPHYDPRTVINIQIAGSKCWHYRELPDVRYPLDSSPSPLPRDLADLRPGQAERTVEMKQGDLLLLPPGAIHYASATSDTSLSLNFSIEYIGISVAEILCRKLRDALLINPEFRRVLRRNVACLDEFDALTQARLNDLAIESTRLIPGCISEIFEESKLYP